MRKLMTSLALFLAAFLVLSPTANAASSSGGRSSGSSGGAARSGGTSRSTSNASRNSTSRNAMNRSGANRNMTSRFQSSQSRQSTSKSLQKSSVRTQTRFTSRPSYVKMNRNLNQLSLNGSTRTFSSYARNPYNNYYYNNNSFQNIWFYAWLFNTNWSSTQSGIAKNLGVDQSDAQQLYDNSYHITIKTANGDDKVVLVTKEQYDQIHPGDKVTLSNNKLYVNGQLLK